MIRRGSCLWPLASHQTGTEIVFELEPFITLAYKAMFESHFVSMRFYKQLLQEDDQFRQRMDAVFQKDWDEKFMIELYPENKVRFGVDLNMIVELLVKNISSETI